MTILYIALAICLVAVLFLTVEARHFKRTKTNGNTRMMSLIEKIQSFRDSTRQEDPAQFQRPGLWPRTYECYEPDGDSYWCNDDENCCWYGCDPQPCSSMLPGQFGKEN